MKKYAVQIVAWMMAFCMLLSFTACNNSQPDANADNGTNAPVSDGQGNNASGDNVPNTESEGGIQSETNQPQNVIQETVDKKPGIEFVDDKIVSDDAQANPIVTPAGEYNKGVVLVKAKDTFDASMLGDLAYVSSEELYAGSKWQVVRLVDAAKTEEAVNYLTQLGAFDKVDYDYVMGVTAKEEENPNYSHQTNLGLSNIPHGWTVNGKAPGGSADVVVAVIDTGVDYTHLDLRNNIWVNTAEIADNGRDDDGNGYVDDVYGWDCVGNDKDPMDDNGHGTHVAGIIAAENNKIGGIGVAYNCKVMVLKAGNSSGYFNNSDIAEAIQYAYMNGASVINMSFGGSFISIAVEDALQDAYNSCVLVAAAGNDGACNNIRCEICVNVGVTYPAALPCVIGVMSTDKDGKNISSFSNYDHHPYDAIEYEVYAVGEGVGSTWPSNKYACLNGTSMAAPTVSGIAALLRSYYGDREMYSTKFIQSQIVNTGTIHPYSAVLEKADDAHSVADVHEAMTKLPKPSVNLYDYYVDDSTAISANNNGNGVVDAGETVRLYVSLHNRGGVASNVNVSIDTDRGMGLTDPYFTFVNSTIALSDIGTYSVRESGDKYFEIIVSPDCPNDYLVDFNIRFAYKNGMDANDKTTYSDDGKAQFTVSRGYLLPANITEDTVFTADRLYIVGQDVMIPAGVTVTFEEGCEIQFYDDREYFNSPVIIVYGSLNFNGSENNMIEIHPNSGHETFICSINMKPNSEFSMNYANCTNINISSDDDTTTPNSIIMNSRIANELSDGHMYCYSYSTLCNPTPCINTNFLENSYINTIGEIASTKIKNNVIVLKREQSRLCPVIGSWYLNSCEGELSNNYIITYDPHYSWSSGGAGIDIQCATVVQNNFITTKNGASINDIVSLRFPVNRDEIKNNTFSSLYQKYASQIIEGYYDSNGNPTVDVYGSCSDITKLWPYVVGVEMFDADGNPITTIGREEIKVRVTFNRPMDITKDTYLTFGTIEPYADYRIDGAYVSDTVWEGTYTLKAQIENGQNYLKVNNACAAEDSTKTVFGEYQLHEFTIDTTAALAMNLQAMPKDEGIELTFAQDDYDTLLGYNVYRSTEKDGNYVKLNPAILLPEETTFLDDNAEPGKTYWYTYTVVLSNFTESNPAGKVQATAKDTMAPSIYHTPVNQGYAGNNLVISCTASDNVGIQQVTLYYRAVGATEWKTLAMNKLNDKFSATIFGTDVTEAGLEYYIVAEDALNTVQKGSADAPYAVVVKSVDALLGLGDVDGNGAVTTKDALMLMQCLNGDLILSDDAFKRADLNKDGLLSSAEALRILQYVNGKITTLEM